MSEISFNHTSFMIRSIKHYYYKIIKRSKLLNTGQVIIGLCVIGLTVWCLLNVINIMNKYFQYETIISLQNNPPNRTDFPGITICAPSIFTPETLASK